MTTAEILIVACIVICAGIAVYSCLIQKGKSNNGSQYAVTTGVLFTFIGIAVGLYHFNTNPDTMTQNINNFLDGMKTVFITSIIGMVTGIIIKVVQSDVEQNADEAVIKKLDEIRDALGTNTMVSLKDELSQLISAMNTFVKTSADSRTDMQEFFAGMKEQSQTLEKLSDKLTESIDELGKKQQQSFEDFSTKITKSGKEQTQRIDTMNELIQKMQTAILQSKQNSDELLSETKTYQQQSLENDKQQAEILTDNTQKIEDMKKAFDEFLKNMSENYSQELIRALNQSMEGLNIQLQKNFGKNFQELNEAVKEVAKWQRDYKDIVEETTEELKSLNATFKQFTDTVTPKVDEHISNLAENIKKFAETSEKNISVQENLNNATTELSNAVQNAKNSVEQMKNLTESFGTFSSQVIAQNNKAIEDYKDTVTKNLGAVNESNEKFQSEINQLRDAMLKVRTDTNHYVEDFGKVSKDALTEVRKTIENFNGDFKEQAEKSVGKIEKIFEEISNETKKTTQAQIATLGGSLAKITETMISNYENLVAKIAEIDKLIAERRNAE